MLRSCVVVALLVCSCKAIHEEPRWIGLAEFQIRNTLGEPSSEHILSLASGSRLHEYQSGLFDHCPDAPGRSVDVKELRWNRLLDTAVVWLVRDSDGDWMVIETLVWSRAVRF